MTIDDREAKRLAQLALHPRHHEKVYAKKLILDRLEETRYASSTTLIDLSPLSIGDASVLSGPLTVESLRTETIREVVSDAEHPSLHLRRLRLAGLHALAELDAAGLVVPVEGGAVNLDRNLFERLDFTSPGGGDSLQFDVVLPRVESNYALPDSSRFAIPWYLDVDLFMEGLEDLAGNRRAVATLKEALSSYRRGLYLASLSLLGAFTEAAWYWGAQQLRNPETKRLGEAIDSGSTSDVQRLVVARLRDLRVNRAELDEVHGHAGFLRRLRNYGVHPKLQESEEELYFTEESAAFVIFMTRHYIQLLYRLVKEA